MARAEMMPRGVEMACNGFMESRRVTSGVRVVGDFRPALERRGPDGARPSESGILSQSKIQLEAELDLTGEVALIRGNEPEVDVRGGGVGIAQDRRVKNIERF